MTSHDYYALHVCVTEDCSHLMVKGLVWRSQPT